MPRKGLSMARIGEILRLKHELGLSNREIGSSCGLSHVSVGQYLDRAAAKGLGWPLPKGLDEDRLHLLLFGAPPLDQARWETLPGFGEIHKELKIKGVTLQLLWEEYRRVFPNGYGYSQFCLHYSRWKETLRLCLRQTYRAGEKVFVDWAGKTVPRIDPDDGSTKESSVFVGALGATNYSYARAFPDQQMQNWIEAHVLMFEFFGGAPRMVVPDNTRTAVTVPCYYEPEIHRTYEEMAAYYGSVVLPARPRSPQDKAKVESAVLCVERRVLAGLRHRTFFSIGEINEAIGLLLGAFNERPFKKMPGSRKELFEQIEKAELLGLPRERYEMGLWYKCKSDRDYHTQVESHHYSVHYSLAVRELEARVTARAVELFHKGARVAVHVRSFIKGGFTTDPAHRPRAHQEHLQWTPEALVEKAGAIGPWAAKVTKAVLDSKPHPEQGYRWFLGIMKLARQYGAQRLEDACHRAAILDSLSFKTLSWMLRTKMELQPLPEQPTPASTGLSHENLRGAEYYLRDNA